MADRRTPELANRTLPHGDQRSRFRRGRETCAERAASGDALHLGYYSEEFTTGFCQLQQAQLGKTSGVLHHAMFENTWYRSTKKNEAVQKTGGFATKKRFF